MTLSKVKFGVIGCSRVASKSMLPAIETSERAELVMIGSRVVSKAREVAEKFDCKSYGSYEDVLNNKAIEAVYISLPNSLHEKWTIKALNAGKHVICEKPAAISYDSAKRMVFAAKRNNVRLLEGLMFRYHPQHKKVISLIGEGALGDLVRFDGCFGYPMPPKDSIMMQKELAGGSLNMSACYPISASRMIFREEPDSVFCNLQFDDEYDVDIKTHLVLGYASGKVAFASSIFGSYYQSTYSILGTKANLRMGRAYAVPRDMATKIFFDTNDKMQEIDVGPADHFRLMIDDFCREISEGSTEKYEDDLLAQAIVIEAAKISYKEKRLVRLSEIKTTEYNL